MASRVCFACFWAGCNHLCLRMYFFGVKGETRKVSVITRRMVYSYGLRMYVCTYFHPVVVCYLLCGICSSTLYGFGNSISQWSSETSLMLLCLTQQVSLLVQLVHANYIGLSEPYLISMPVSLRTWNVHGARGYCA